MIPAEPFLWMLVVLLGVWFAVWVYNSAPFRRICRQAMRHPILAVVACAFIVYGSTKPERLFSFAAGLTDDGSYATNDTVHVEWVKTGTPYVPDSATLYVDYRERGSTNEWLQLAETTVGEYSLDIALANATNYNYNIWYYYIPPAPVVTNGVWKYTTQKAKADAPANAVHILPLKARTEADGTSIDTPGQKGEL